MFVKLPPIPVSSQPVPAIYTSVPRDRAKNAFVIPETVKASTAVESVSTDSEPSQLNKTQQAIWHERATVSRAYAKILLDGGSLG